MIPCVWYVSEITRPWERSLIGSMASALRARGIPLSVFIDGGTMATEGENIYSWQALSLVERVSRILGALSGRSLWHLWGEAPSWWPIVQFRSRTVHTSLADSGNSSLNSSSSSFDSGNTNPDSILGSSPEATANTWQWRGHPSRIFHSQARDGETVLVPTFEVRIVRGLDYDDNSDSDPAVYVNMTSTSQALKNALADLDLKIPIVDTDKVYLGTSPARSGVLIAGDSPSDAIRAAVLTVHGLIVVAQRSPYLNELLGPNGYFVIEQDTSDEWRHAIHKALSDEGRVLAPSVRHFIKTRYTAERCADSLIALYSKVTRVK